MKTLRVTVKPFQGTIPFHVLLRGRVLVEDIFSGKCRMLSAELQSVCSLIQYA